MNNTDITGNTIKDNVKTSKTEINTILLIFLLLAVITIFFGIRHYITSEGAVCQAQPFTYGAQKVSEATAGSGVSCFCTIENSAIKIHFTEETYNVTEDFMFGQY